RRTGPTPHAPRGPRREGASIRAFHSPMQALTGATVALRAEVAELVDAPDSKSGGGDLVWVRVPPSALSRRLLRRGGRRTCYDLPVPIRGWRLGVAALVAAVAAIATVAGSGSAGVLQDACTTPVYQNGIDVVFGRASTQAAADRITRKATGVGFPGVKTVRDTCRVWKSALRGLNSSDVAGGVQSEARRVRLFPTVECVRAQEIGQFQAVFGTRRTLADLQGVIEQANSKGYTGIKTKPAPCGGYEAYVSGFS